MKKNTLIILLIFCFFSFNTNVSAQNKSKSRKEATVFKKDGTSVSGNVKNFYGAISFEKVEPLYLIKRLFNKDLPNYFGDGPQSLKKIKIKTPGSKKFEEIPFEEVEGVLYSRSFKTSGGDKTYFKAFSGPSFYGKSSKTINLALPTLTQGQVINTYGSIYPIRKMILIFYPILFEVGSPDALGYVSIENKKKKIAISLDLIQQEKKYSLAKVKRRAESSRNKNHNSIMELFGDCPEVASMIDKYYIKRIENTTERKQAAIKYNEIYRNNLNKFKKIIKKARYKATPELYLELYEFDLTEIIRTYEKNCLPIDEFDPRHENYIKEFDLINRQMKDSL